MKLIKYWKVQLLKLSHSSGALCSRNPDDTLLFEGYSKDKPNIKLGTGLSIELFTAPDSVETCIFRDHLVDGVLCIPVYERGDDEDDDETDGTQEEQAEHELEDVVKPIIKWLNENASAHTSVYIDRTGAKQLLLTGEAGIHAEGFIKD
ncbi:hypothetical protein BL175_00019635 [Klebsiella pneumoniae]|uniref:hypothetical protein n=1 Tax=Klebsiella pneumoniae TaxID=573 RepID=UPI000935D2F3|nr:hypothetical protein [Klebsiella pneumoniae]RNQ27020.1 hypothetical protein BL175_00019635 [Klebsiella pneumoniae]RNQ47343.1 hypothetical protein BL176_00007400 [Klebsiella pneumoniae]